MTGENKDQDLEDARIAARNVLEDLLAERAALAETAKKLARTAAEKEEVRAALAETAKKLARTAAEFAQLNAKNEAMLASIGEGLVATDKNGRIVLVNSAFEKMLGWNGPEVRGKSLSEVLYMTDASGKEIPDSERLATKILKKEITTTTNTATNFRRKDGTFFPVALTASPITLGPELIGAVNVFRDITKEKEVDKAKTEFISLASHQLRTPLSTVSWYVEMLLGGDVGKLTKKQEKYLDEVRKGNQRIVTLVNDLLDVSRLELGIFVAEAAPIDAVALVRSVADEQQLQIDRKKIVFSFKSEKGFPLLNADSRLLRMVVQNLLSNAVKYTPEGGKIEISLALKDKKDVLLKISDTGYGIPANQQDKIFTKLFRADNVRVKDTEGTGLGLYIVKSVVEHSGGKVWFSSEENKGSTFFVTLPIKGVEKKQGANTLP